LPPRTPKKSIAGAAEPPPHPHRRWLCKSPAWA